MSLIGIALETETKSPSHKVNQKSDWETLELKKKFFISSVRKRPHLAYIFNNLVNLAFSTKATFENYNNYSTDSNKASNMIKVSEICTHALIISTLSSCIYIVVTPIVSIFLLLSAQE